MVPYSDPDPGKSVLNLTALFCASCRDWPQKYVQTFRPRLPEHEYRPFLVETDDRVRQTLEEAALRMHSCLRDKGKDQLLRSYDPRRAPSLKDDMSLKLKRRSLQVVQAVGAVFYDQAWTGRRAEYNNGRILCNPNPEAPWLFSSDLVEPLKCTLEHMLLIDYGFPPTPVQPAGVSHTVVETFLRVRWLRFNAFTAFFALTVERWSQGQIPNDVTWGELSRWLGMLKDDDLEVWDLAILLHYYNTRREETTTESYHRGWTGYTGVLQEMIDEVPTRGTRRLEGKLSLDAHVLIPRFVHDSEKREKMVERMRELKKQHELALMIPAPKPIEQKSEAQVPKPVKQNPESHGGLFKWLSRNLFGGKKSREGGSNIDVSDLGDVKKQVAG